MVHGQARFRFRHVLSGEAIELIARADQPAAVETVPGWAHDVTNIGGDDWQITFSGGTEIIKLTGVTVNLTLNADYVFV